MPTRTWGDGYTDRRDHVIADISFAEDWVDCRCGKRVSRGDLADLEWAWDLHRGVPVFASIHELGEQADDREVAEFLKRAEDPTYQSVIPGDQAVTRGGPDLEALAEALAHFQALAARCTCRPGRRNPECPNNQEGD